MAIPFGNATSAVVGAAVGIAGADVAAPALERAKQEAWRKNAYRILDLTALAELVAEGAVEYADARSEAQLGGFDANHFAAVVELSKAAPDVSFALGLWRKGLLGRPDSDAAIATVRHALRKAKIEPQWDDAVLDLYDARLDPSIVANAIVRGVIDPPFDLPGPARDQPGKVPAFPSSPLDALAEVRAAGWDKERLFVQTAISGRPPGPESAAAAYFRSIIEHADYIRAVAEGDVRTEWAETILETARAILSPAEYVNLLLRGWITPEAMHAGAGKHGMSPDDADLLALGHGRPLSWHQVWIGLARGGEYDVLPPDADPAFVKALRESDIRPEWYGLAWAQRYSYPSAFVLRSLAQSGDLTQPEVDEILRFEGWEPTLAEKVSKRWAAGGSSAAREATAADLLTLLDGGRATEPETLAALRDLGYSDQDAQHKVDVVSARRVASAKGTTITDVHAKYKKQAIDAEVAISTIEQLGVPTWAATAMVHAWALGVGAVEPT